MRETLKPRRALSVGLWLLVGFAELSCTTPCESEVAPPVEADFSSLRLDGTYLCDLFDGCTVRFEGQNRAIMTITDKAAGPAEITYDVAYGPTLQQKQKVTSSITLGGQQPQRSCATTHNYRWETWTVPAVTFTAVSATRNGQALPLTATERILHLPASTFATLTVQTHYIDRTKGDAYVGVLTKSSAASAWSLAITRDGGRLNIGPA